MTGKDLQLLLQKSPHLLGCHVQETIKELLRMGLINPSTLIDSHLALVREELDRIRMHYKEGNVAAYCMMYGDDRQVELGKNRLMYNAQFDGGLPYHVIYADRLSEEERKERQKFFALTYGFSPEDHKKI